MQQLRVTVGYDLAMEGKADVDWLRGRIDTEVRKELTDGVEAFEVVEAGRPDCYVGPAFAAASGALTLRFDHYSVDDADYDPEDDEDPAVDSEFLEECVRAGLDRVLDGAGGGNMMLSLWVVGSQAVALRG